MHKMSLGEIVLFVFLSIFSIAFFIFPHKTIAQENFSSGNTPTLPKSKTINEDYFAAGGTVVISGTVNGDVYAAGGNVLVNGTVNGDVLAVGGNVTVNGKVTGNVRAAGGQITIGADVGRNVTTAGGSIAIQDPAKIAGSLTAAGGTIAVLASIGKGATFAGNQVSIDTAIGGNVNAGVQNLQVSSQSHIAGSLNYWSKTKANIPGGVAGKGITYHQSTFGQNRQPSQGAFTGFNIIWELISLVSSFIIGLVLLWLVPLFMQNISGLMMTRLGTSFAVGLAAVIAIPIACIFLLVTIIGIPLAGVLFGAFLLYAYINKIFVSYAIGRKILPQKHVVALIVGLVIYGLIGVIPVLGGIWKFIVLCVGLGAFILIEKSLYLQARTRKII